MRVVVRELERDEPEEKVSRLRALAYPDFREAGDTGFYESLYRWHGTHPLADQVYRWVAVTEEGGLVGHLNALPQYYRVNGRRVVAHTPGDYMVLDGYGFQALSLMRRFFRATENCVACDMVPAVIQVESRLGAEVVGELQYAAKLLNVSRLPVPPVPERIRKALNLPEQFAPARGYLTSAAEGAEPETAAEAPNPGRPRLPIPAPLKAAFNGGLAWIDAVLSGGYGVDLGGRKIEVEVLEGFDESFDELFEKVATVVPCIPEKDSAFLKWRYGPGSPQYPVTVLGVRDGQRLLGYAVLKTLSTGEDGFILDLTTLPGYREVGRALLRESVRHFREQGAHLIRYRFLESPPSPHHGDLRRLGFFYRKGRGNWLLTRFSDPEMHEASQDLDHWSYNVGDGEATFWIR
ncbi:MAG: GNAT family N-acetyltransferase [Rubrobacter sp.]|nr:GNAT family N-acetyltransferase [Rubrobacter sp.]